MGGQESAYARDDQDIRSAVLEASRAITDFMRDGTTKTESPPQGHDERPHRSGAGINFPEPLQRVLLPYCVGQWLPSDQGILNRWMKNLFQKVESLPDYQKACDRIKSTNDLSQPFPDLLPPVQELKDLVENDPIVNMYFLQMLTQVPKAVKSDPEGKPVVGRVVDVLYALNYVIQRAPEYTSKHTGVVGVPITAIFAWCMGTNAGTAMFLNEKFNKVLKKILNHWSDFLKTEDSKYVLLADEEDPDCGWLGANAQKEMFDFEESFVCDPNDPYYGFKSWDDFFTRQLKDGARPIASPDDDSVIVNACESVPYKLRRNVQRQSRFWIKSQPYSLVFMLANDPFTEQFVGGTVYQAFLSSRSYHRWHSPVNGEIVKAYVVDGSYYAELEFESFEEQDLKLQNQSQAYLTEVATRALIFIQADNDDIGLMCFMAVGMVEVSSCDITVKVGQRVKKGEQLGMFHYGGSTHCLVFRCGVELEFVPEKEFPIGPGLVPILPILIPGIIPNIPGFPFPGTNPTNTDPDPDDKPFSDPSGKPFPGPGRNTFPYPDGTNPGRNTFPYSDGTNPGRNTFPNSDGTNPGRNTFPNSGGNPRPRPRSRPHPHPNPPRPGPPYNYGFDFPLPEVKPWKILDTKCLMNVNSKIATVHSAKS